MKFLQRFPGSNVIYSLRGIITFMLQSDFQSDKRLVFLVTTCNTAASQRNAFGCPPSVDLTLILLSSFL